MAFLHLLHARQVQMLRLCSCADSVAFENASKYRDIVENLETRGSVLDVL